MSSAIPHQIIDGAPGFGDSNPVATRADGRRGAPLVTLAPAEAQARADAIRGPIERLETQPAPEPDA
jgi:hypothetical protein